MSAQYKHVRIPKDVHDKLLWLKRYYTDAERRTPEVNGELNREGSVDFLSIGFVIGKCVDETLDHIKRNRKEDHGVPFRTAGHD